MRAAQTEDRIVSYDLTRIIALLLVVTCHFFLYGDYYEIHIIGSRLFFLTGLRTLSIAAVPLFLITTGCVMRKKTLCKRYYFGLFRILTIYVLASVCHILLRICILKEAITLRGAVLQILNYGVEYGWYLEMYLGLFLLIPFLNILFGQLARRQKEALIATMLILTALPGILNIFNFETPGWWANPSITTLTNRLVPDYWVLCYPITYYYIGSYLDEYRIRINRGLNVALFAIVLLLSTALSYARSRNTLFVNGQYQNFGAFPVVILSVLLFLLINGLDMQKMPVALRNAIFHVSNLTLGAYLISGFFDYWLYSIPSKLTGNLHGLAYYFEKAPLVLACSLAVSFVVQCAYRGLYRLLFLRKHRCRALAQTDGASGMHEEKPG